MPARVDPSLMPLMRRLSARRRLAVRALALGLVVLLAAFVGHVALGFGGDRLDGLSNGVVYNAAIMVGAAGLCLARAFAVRAERRAWGAIGAGLAFFAAGEVYWQVFLAPLGDRAPYPSLYDAVILCFYPLAYTGLGLLARPHMRRLPRSAWLDGAIAALGLAALAAAFVFPPIVAGAAGRPAAVATNLAYPIGDVVLLALVAVIFTVCGWRPGRAWALIGAGLALFAAGDVLYLLAIAAETYAEGTPLDALWPTGAVLIALAAWQRPRDAAAVRAEGWAVLAVPATFALAALELLVINHFVDLNLVALALSVATLLAGGARTGLTFRDVRALAESRQLALTDELTGLTNRRGFFARLGEALVAAEAEGAHTALLLIDLDRFKELNDTLGHGAGDRLLEQLGPRLTAALPARATVARLGGDEFAALLQPGTDPAGARACARAVHEAIVQPFRVSGLTVHVGASVGMALFPEHATGGDALLHCADVAMYRAKAARTDVELYARGDEGNARGRLLVAEELRGAIGRGELVLHYQPKGDLHTRHVGGVEALARWDHPRRGLLAPAEFIPVAEQTELMRPLTLYVLDRALRQLVAWERTGRSLKVAVNVSVANLLDAGFPAQVGQILERRRVPPGRLELEVTESLVMADPMRAADVLGRLGELGVGLSLDDFGTGQSSLAWLRRLPVHELKIDRSFVGNLIVDAKDAAIVRAAAQLARSLGLRVVAEGVETAEAWHELGKLPCDLGQGFYLSRPLPAHELMRWLEARSAAAPAPGQQPGSPVRAPAVPE